MDAVTGAIVHSLPPDSRGPLPSAMQLVGKVDDYLEAAGSRPVHISEICAHLNVSRRTLHRAFLDVLGLGPMTYLRHKRLCAIHSVLRDSNPATSTVAQVAIQHGFIELGRFSHYYHSLFGEYPSETLGGRGALADRETGGSCQDNRLVGGGERQNLIARPIMPPSRSNFFRSAVVDIFLRPDL